MLFNIHVLVDITSRGCGSVSEHGRTTPLALWGFLEALA
jgi:hypothetical protein